ncbi:hypothetical protein FF1_006973 [Malus domestica]
MGALRDLYVKCGVVAEALNVFNRLPDRDLVSWTSMITAYGSHGQSEMVYGCLATLTRHMERDELFPNRAAGTGYTI